jgi:hypothetical protein
MEKQILQVSKREPGGSLFSLLVIWVSESHFLGRLRFLTISVFYDFQSILRELGQ